MKHKHAEVIKAWADNPELHVEFRYDGGRWHSCHGMPAWEEDNEYRIKPEPQAKVYPETRMSTKELWQTWSNAAHSSAGNLAIANAALRHAIDSGQLVEPAKIDRIEPDTFSPLMEAAKEQRAARDMAIADAVHRASIATVIPRSPMSAIAIMKIDLPAIIATVKD